MPYNMWKIGKHYDHIVGLKSNNSIAPIAIKLILTNECKRTCNFCFDKEKNELFKSVIDTDVVLKALKEAYMMGAKSLEFTGGGEPTDHPEFEMILKCALDIGYDVGLVTNGTNLNEIDLSLISKLEWLRISINAYSDEMYERISGIPLNYRDALIEIGRLEIYKSASFVITHENYLEIVEFTKYLSKLGFDSVRFTPERHDTEIDSRLAVVWNDCINLIREARTYDDEFFKVFAMEERFETLNTVEKSFENCNYQHIVANIWSDGELLPCCELRGYEGAGYGSLYNKSFKEIWENKQPIPVSKCSIACLFSGKNEFLEYLLHDSPPHINFV